MRIQCVPGALFPLPSRLGTRLHELVTAVESYHTRRLIAYWPAGSVCNKRYANLERYGMVWYQFSRTKVCTVHTFMCRLLMVSVSFIRHCTERKWYPFFLPVLYHNYSTKTYMPHDHLHTIKTQTLLMYFHMFQM